MDAAAAKLAAGSAPLATETLADFCTHNLMIAVRHATGQAELHQRMADVFVIRSGSATLIVGGQINGAKTVAAGEIRGPSIRLGESHVLRAGDVIHIPAGMPHQLILTAGETLVYFVVKASE